MSERAFYLSLSLANGIGINRFKNLIEKFKTAENAWKANDKSLKEVLGEKVFEDFNKFRQSSEPEKILQEIENQGIEVLTLPEKTYPSLLKEIFDAPRVLFGRGKILENKKVLGVVGTRKVTSYGRQVTNSLVKELVGQGFTIVSGLARGVDSIAHRTTLENGGATMAVLGSGLNQIYPPENEKLAVEIAKTGAVISELSPETVPNPGYFPARNRIISGLSLGILVTEAGEESGSLITAGFALDQNREVFAVPGPIYSKLSTGPANLIKQGAKLVNSVEDILEELNMNSEIKNQTKIVKGETKEEEKIINLLKNENVHVDALIRKTGLSAEKIGPILLTLELKNKIKNLGNGFYSLSI